MNITSSGIFSVAGRIFLGLLVFMLMMGVMTFISEVHFGIKLIKPLLQFTAFLGGIAYLIYKVHTFFNEKFSDRRLFWESVKSLNQFLLYFLFFNLFYLLVGYCQADNMQAFKNELNVYRTNISAIKFLHILLVAVGEEVLCRYYFTGTLVAGKVNIYVTVIISSLIFSLLHATQYPIALLAILFLTGVVLSQFFILSRSLAVPISLHAAHNLRATTNHIDKISWQDVIEGELPVIICFVILTVVWIIKKPTRRDVINIYTSGKSSLKKSLATLQTHQTSES